MHPPEQAVHPPKRFSIKTQYLFHKVHCNSIELRWIFYLLRTYLSQICDRYIAGLPSKHIYAIMKKPLIFVRAARLPSAANEMILRKDL